MNWAFITSGKWLKGSVRLWLFDLGCASFLGVGLLGLVMALAMPFMLPDDAERKVDTLMLLMNMFVASTCVAIGWQMNRLAATEWAAIVPQYRQSVMLQALGLLITSLLIATIFLAAHNAFDKFDELLLTLLFGLGFLYFSLNNSSAFHLSFVLYVSLPMLPYLAGLLPATGSALLLFADLVLAALLWRKLSRFGWNSKARIVYLNGLEMGWFWLPSLKSSKLLNRFERYLHPANYFIGPMLTMMLLAMPVVTLILALGAYMLDVQLPVLFLLIQFSSIACAMLHWSRIQRWRAVESLFVLPGFDGKKGMIDAFMLAQYRLLAILTVSMMVTAALVSLLSPLISLSVWSHIVLSNVIGCAAILGLGSMCRTSMQISATIFFVALQSGWVSSSLSTVQSGGDIWHWVAWDVPLLILAFFCLWYGKYRLWRGDLLSS